MLDNPLTLVYYSTCRMVEHKEVIKDMAKVTTDEMVALINEDIKFAEEIGDKEFVGYLKETKDKLLKEMGEAVAKEYVELFGK